MLISHFQLLRPWWLLALIPLTLMLIRLWRNSSAECHWQDVCDPQLLPYLLIGSRQPRRYCYTAILGFCWLCSVIALSGPTWQRLPLSVYKAQQAQVVVLDLSANMTAADIKPNRLTRARYKLLDMLHHSQEQQTGLIVFTSKPFVVSPLTQDAETIATMVPALSPSIVPVKGEDIGAALTKAAGLFKQASVSKGRIILITASKPTRKDEAIAARIKDEGFKLWVLGVGTALGAPTVSSVFDDGTTTPMARLDRTSLERLARIGGGRYIPFSDTNADVESIVQAAHPNFTDTQKTAQTLEIWVDQGYWWILPILILMGLTFRRGWFESLAQ